MKKKITLVSLWVILALVTTACHVSQASTSSASNSPAASTSPSTAPSVDSESASPVSASESASASVSESVSVSLPSPLHAKDATTYVLTNTGIESDATTLYTIDGYSDIPFLDISDSLNLLQRSLSDSTLTTSLEGVVTVGRSENTATVSFDFNSQTVTFSNLDLYSANHGKNSVLNLISSMGTLDDGVTPKYLMDYSSLGIDNYRQGNVVTIDLKKYSVPTHWENGRGYLPVQTFADLVFSPRNIVLAFNGENLYMSGAEFSDDMLKTFYSVAAKDRSEAMALYSRNELALLLDFQYGLKDAHNITDFDTFFKQTGLDDKLLSTDALVASKGMQELVAKYLGDYHSYLQYTSAYAGQDALETVKKDTTLKSPSFQEYQLIRYAYASARTGYFKNLYGKTAPASYETFGKDATSVKDTAYITFDNFTMPSDGTDYYKTAPTAAATDTYGIMAYAYSQITNDSNIKNIVLDLSCNSGGSINAGIYAAGAFLPYSILNTQDTATGAQGEFTFRSDMNLDGKYTQTDYFIGLGKGYKLYCLVSPAIFSCSNLVSSLFKESNQVRLIGGNTGGGACIVQHASTADGTSFRTSGNRRLCTMRNGAYQPIEDGIKVDYSLDGYDDYFNRTKLTNFIENL